MNKGRVLLVDDDMEILEICSEVLQSHDFEVVAFEGARQALQALLAGNLADVIITDFRMPEMDGLEFMEALNKARLHIPVMMFTGVADKDLAIKALNAGCHFLIEKPLRNQELIHYTEQAMVYGRWEHISERLLKECNDLIKLLRDLSSIYEIRFTQAENIVYQNKTGAQLKPGDIQGYLKNISQGISIETEIQNATKTVDVLGREHAMLQTIVRK